MNIKRPVIFFIVAALVISTPFFSNCEVATSDATQSAPPLSGIYTNVNIYVKQHKYNGAIEELKKIVDREPKNYAAKKLLATYSKLLGKLEDSAEYYRQILEKEAGNRELKLQYADVVSFTRKKELAIPIYRELLKESPKDPLIMEKLADVLSFTGHFDESISIYQELNNRDPRNKSLIKKLINVIVWGQKYEDALKIYYSLLQEEPDNIELQTTIAETKVFMGVGGEAVNIYNEILIRNPKDLRVLLGRARAYEWGGFPEKALEYYREILNIYPENKEAQDKVNWLYLATANTVNLTYGYMKWKGKWENFSLSKQYTSSLKLNLTSEWLFNFEASTSYNDEDNTLTGNSHNEYLQLRPNLDMRFIFGYKQKKDDTFDNVPGTRIEFYWHTFFNSWFYLKTAKDYIASDVFYQENLVELSLPNRSWFDFTFGRSYSPYSDGNLSSLLYGRASLVLERINYDVLRGIQISYKNETYNFNETSLLYWSANSYNRQKITIGYSNILRNSYFDLGGEASYVFEEGDPEGYFPSGGFAWFNIILDEKDKIKFNYMFDSSRYPKEDRYYMYLYFVGFERKL